MATFLNCLVPALQNSKFNPSTSILINFDMAALTNLLSLMAARCWTSTFSVNQPRQNCLICCTQYLEFLEFQYGRQAPYASYTRWATGSKRRLVICLGQKSLWLKCIHSTIRANFFAIGIVKAPIFAPTSITTSSCSSRFRNMEASNSLHSPYKLKLRLTQVS